MGVVSVFNNVSLDGYFCDARGSMSWAHQQDPEWLEFVSGNASGSGTIVSQLTAAAVIDSYQVVVHPIVLGSGRTMFEGVTTPVNLALTKTRAFKNGSVVLWYQRMR